MNLKNTSKLLAVAMVFGGCISKEPVAHHSETKTIKPDGREEVKETTWVGNESQFTVLGNAYNGVTYGIMGCGYGAYKKCYDGVTSTNNVPVVGPVANGVWGLISGAVEGLYVGTFFGLQMKYGEALTFDDIVAEQVESNVLKAKAFADKCVNIEF